MFIKVNVKRMLVLSAFFLISNTFSGDLRRSVIKNKAGEAPFLIRIKLFGFTIAAAIVKIRCAGVWDNPFKAVCG